MVFVQLYIKYGHVDLFNILYISKMCTKFSVYNFSSRFHYFNIKENKYVTQQMYELETMAN